MIARYAEYRAVESRKQLAAMYIRVGRVILDDVTRQHDQVGFPVARQIVSDDPL